MDESSANGRFRYIHEKDKCPLEGIDIHHIIVQRNKLKGFILRLSGLLLLASPIFFFSLQRKSISVLLWSLLLVVVSMVELLVQKLVEKESVIILPAFGVQFETQYESGRTIRRFVPFSKILKPVINECVTQATR